MCLFIYFKLVLHVHLLHMCVYLYFFILSTCTYNANIVCIFIYIVLLVYMYIYIYMDFLSEINIIINTQSYGKHARIHACMQCIWDLPFGPAARQRRLSP